MIVLLILGENVVSLPRNVLITVNLRVGIRYSKQMHRSIPLGLKNPVLQIKEMNYVCSVV